MIIIIMIACCYAGALGPKAELILVCAAKLAGVVPSGRGSSGRKRTNADEHLAASFLETEEDSDEAVYLCELNLRMHDEARTRLHKAAEQRVQAVHQRLEEPIVST